VSVVRDPSLRLRAYRHLRRKILDGELRAGHVLSENTVAKEIGISRTPVREAIRDLEQEGLLQQVPRFGTVVRSLSRRDLAELFELREALEPFAAARAAGQVAPADLVLLEKLCGEIAAVASALRASRRAVPEPEEMRRLLTADLGFHLILLRAAGNRRMLKIVGDSRLLTGIFRTRRQEHDLPVIEETLGYHRRILDAVRSGDGPAAAAAMAEHLGTSKREALEHFDRAERLPDPPDMPLPLPEDFLAELRRIEERP
jgi:DNA-binding GntR family transcriptional regulator